MHCGGENWFLRCRKLFVYRANYPDLTWTVDRVPVVVELLGRALGPNYF